MGHHGMTRWGGSGWNNSRQQRPHFHMLARGTREMVQAVMYFHEDLSVILNAHVKICALWHWVCVWGGGVWGGE